MSTSDNDKKAIDKQAKREEKNKLREENKKSEKNSVSKETDHL